MSQHVQPHVQNLDRSQMQDVNFPPLLQCSIPSSSMFNFPLSTAMITSESRSPSTLVVDITESNMDHITSLEHSLCSNFFCCGVQLADLHALLEHFEENHIVVLAPNGKRVYPRDGLCAVPLDPASGTSTPSSSRASSVTPASPLTPQTPLSPSPPSPSTLLPWSSPPASRKSSFTVAPVYTPFTPSLPIDPADPLLDSSEIVMSQEPAFDFSVHPSFFPPLAPEISSEVSSSSEDEGNSEASPIHDIAIGSDHERDSFLERPLNVRFISAMGGGKRRTDKPLKSSKSRRHASSGSHSKRREKMYRCPKNGCVKAYLNPNGLKYHLEKGTCKLAEDEDDTPQDGTKRSRPSTPVCAHVIGRASQPRNATSNTIPKLEERSTVKTTIDSQGDDVSQPLSHTNIAFHGIHPVPNPSSGLQVHSYPYPMEVTPAPLFKIEELPLSSPTLSALPIPPQPTPPLSQSHSVPYTTQLPPQIQFHYPIPTYPNGYIYAPQPRPYFTAELATYEAPGPLPANGTIAPSISQ